MDLVQDFKERRHLCDEVDLTDAEKSKSKSKRKKSTREVAINKLSTIIRNMELEVDREIGKLEAKTQEMIGLVSVFAAYVTADKTR